MYYIEQIINGKLMFKTSPNGEWNEVKTDVGQVVNEILTLSEKDRLHVLEYFKSDFKKFETF